MVSGAAKFAARAFSFDRLVVSGLLAIVAVTMFAAFLILILPFVNKELAELVIPFYKDVVLILVGALANSVRNRADQRIDDRSKG